MRQSRWDTSILVSWPVHPLWPTRFRAKSLVPQCGGAMHTLCFGSLLLPSTEGGGTRGSCCRCGLSCAWNWNKVDPLLNAFCLYVGEYFEKTRLAGRPNDAGAPGLAELGRNFSEETTHLVSPTAAGILLTKRRELGDIEAVEALGDLVLNILLPPSPPSSVDCEEDHVNKADVMGAHECTAEDAEPVT